MYLGSYQKFMMKIFCEKILTAFRRKLFCEKLCCRCLTKLSIFHISICHIFLKNPIILIEKPVILIEKLIISMCNSHFDKKISFSNWKPTFTFPIAKKKQTSFESKNLLFWSRVRKLHVFNASVIESAVGLLVCPVIGVRLCGCSRLRDIGE